MVIGVILKEIPRLRLQGGREPLGRRAGKKIGVRKMAKGVPARGYMFCWREKKLDRTKKTAPIE